MKPPSIQDISIGFSDESLLVLNICLGFIMFGVALGMDFGNFRHVLTEPRAVITGAVSQFILLPAVTFALVYLAAPYPSFALGMILVAACPGGNISNFISSISRADIALSVSLTAIATVLSPVFTPLNFEFWSGLLPSVGSYLTRFELSFMEMLRTVVLLLVIPLLGGMLFKRKFPSLAARIHLPVRILSLLILAGFIGVALYNNFDAFLSYLSQVFFLVLVHNFLAFLIGYFTSRGVNLGQAARRSISIETGIQNSGLGLIIIFNFFEGNGGMAIIAAWWGIWHILAGLGVAGIFRIADRMRVQRT